MAYPVWQRTIVDNSGNVVPNAEVEVINEATGTAATIYSDRDGNTERDNPFFADGDGFARFYALPGEYRVTATGPSGTMTWRYQVLTGTSALRDLDNMGDISADSVNCDAYLADGQDEVVSAWDSGETYTAGEVVSRYGMHFTATGESDNTNKDPIDPQNVDYWYRSPGVDKLIELANRGISERGGMHKVNDVQDADYQTSLLLDKAKFGTTTYKFYLVHLDGSTVSGNATLEGILDPGGAKEYPFIDLYAPEDVGTRTLVDKRGYVDRPMTDTGGDAEALAEMQEDQMQRITGYLGNGSEDKGVIYKVADVTSQKLDNGGALSYSNESSGDGSANDGTSSYVRFEFDSADSPSARTSTETDGETRVKAMVEGLGYIIVMIAE